MSDETEGADGKDENVRTALPNTLAWAAHACELAGEQKSPLWRIMPDVLIERQPRLAPKGPSGRALEPDSSAIPSTENKS